MLLQLGRWLAIYRSINDFSFLAQYYLEVWLKQPLKFPRYNHHMYAYKKWPIAHMRQHYYPHMRKVLGNSCNRFNLKIYSSHSLDRPLPSPFSRSGSVLLYHSVSLFLLHFLGECRKPWAYTNEPGWGRSAEIPPGGREETAGYAWACKSSFIHPYLNSWC